MKYTRKLSSISNKSCKLHNTISSRRFLQNTRIHNIILEYLVFTEVGESMINIAICDDNIPFTEYIETKLLQLQPSCTEKIMTTIFYSGESFCKSIETNCVFDIVLMDIEMEGIDGIKVGEFLRAEDENDKVFLIYISSHDTYWKQLFDVQPYAFLEKPLNEVVFYEKIKKVFQKIQMLRSEGKRNVLPIQQNGHELLIPMKKILYLESNIRKVTAYALEETFEYYSTLNKEEKKLDSKEFIRTHQSYIVNLRYARKITNEGIILINNIEIPVSYSRRTNIKKTYIEYRRNYFD